MISVVEIALQTPVLRHMPEDRAVSLLTRANIREAGRGASIHLQGERAHSLFIIIDGWVKLYRMSPCGCEAVVAVLTRGDSFGEAAAIRGEVYATGAESVSEVTMMQIDGSALWQLIDEDAESCRALLAASLNGNRQLVLQLEQMKSHSGAQRIADFLLGLCRDETGTCTVVLPFDKNLIAGWLGMKPESLSRSFRRLEAYGVKIVKNRATIESIERLTEFAEEDPSASWSAKACKTG